ncbi:protein CDV3 homolog isoform X1 [Empidonax traillii]|uniref:protein CDV3 homolog isoform X1 n=1 Tax=Empidonax traillii TaxID=164674 RepID=UPI000FFD51D0|nr:protein CDV3 homolog isoform X1 [Empidonax traillii]
MAETEERSLDDFFAKRDKKKRKEKSSRSAAAAASGASNAASNAAAAGTPRPAEGGGSGATAASSAAGGSSAKAASKEEDDWKEFEQKEEIDYSGLRVQSMQISEKEDDESEKREEPGDNWEETGGGGVDRSSGPWNKSAPAPAPVVEPIVTEAPEPVQTGGVYRPPGAREGGRPRRAQQGPPEIYSDTQFPSLQSTAKLVDSRKAVSWLHSPRNRKGWVAEGQSLQRWSLRVYSATTTSPRKRGNKMVPLWGCAHLFSPQNQPPPPSPCDVGGTE